MAKNHALQFTSTSNLEHANEQAKLELEACTAHFSLDLENKFGRAQSMSIMDSVLSLADVAATKDTLVSVNLYQSELESEIQSLPYNTEATSQYFEQHNCEQMLTDLASYQKFKCVPLYSSRV
eukprot:jgi/Hompol1/2289/HPOL_002888-RA